MADLAGTSAARDRQLRSWLRHERMTVRIALAEALHQSCGHRSSTAGPRRFSEEFAAETLFSQLTRRKKKRRSSSSRLLLVFSREKVSVFSILAGSALDFFHTSGYGALGRFSSLFGVFVLPVECRKCPTYWR